MKILNYLFYHFPILEVLSRKVYYKFFFNFKRHNKSMGSHKKSFSTSFKTSFYEYIDKLNIHEGDFLIIHSSFSNLSEQINPIEFLNYILDKIGKNGNLALPTHVIEKKGGNTGNEYYDLDSKICSTGILPNLFLRKKGVIRSKYPNNNLSIFGPLALSVTKSNLDTDLSHGKNSSWYNAYLNKAKILFINVDASRSTTIVHCAEDILDEEWPVKDWYQNHEVIIKYNGVSFSKNIRVRKSIWSMYMTSKYRSKQLKKNHIMYDTNIEGIHLGFVENSKDLVDFIISKAKIGHLFFRVPKKFRR